MRRPQDRLGWQDYLEGAQLQCPWCWRCFSADECLWISSHSNLKGDPILGCEEALRFLPSRFHASGKAIDVMGVLCQSRACPHCRLEFPGILIGGKPFTISLVGAPLSGKSFFLAGLNREFQRLGRKHPGFRWTDWPQWNSALHEYGDQLFRQTSPSTLVFLEKTRKESALYVPTQRDGRQSELLRPYIFRCTYSEKRQEFVVLVYENSARGLIDDVEEEYNRERPDATNADALIYVFDPLQSPGFRQAARERTGIDLESRYVGKDLSGKVLSELANRARLTTLTENTRRPRQQLIVVVTHSDLWSQLIEEDLSTEPLSTSSDSDEFALDIQQLDRVSDRIRRLLIEHSTEVVMAADDLADIVRFIPVSALGNTINASQESGKVAIRAGDIRPSWVTVPFLYALRETTGDLSAGVQQTNSASSDEVESFEPSKFLGLASTEAKVLSQFRTLSNLCAPLPVRLLALRNVAAISSAFDADIDEYEKLYLKEIADQLPRSQSPPSDASPGVQAILTDLLDPRWRTAIPKAVRDQIVEIATQSFSVYVLQKVKGYETFGENAKCSYRTEELDNFLGHVRRSQEFGIPLSPEATSRINSLNAALERCREQQALDRSHSEYKVAFDVLSQSLATKSDVKRIAAAVDTFDSLAASRPAEIAAEAARDLRSQAYRILRRAKWRQFMASVMQPFRRAATRIGPVDARASSRRGATTAIGSRPNRQLPLDGQTRRVFVSHSSRDRELVENDIVRTLNSAGIDTWYSVDDINIASDWEDRIQAGLKASHWFLLVMSRNSAASPWVKSEVRWALDHMPGRVIPLLIDDVDPCEFSLKLQRVQHIDFRDQRSKARQQLVDFLDGQPDAPPWA